MKQFFTIILLQLFVSTLAFADNLNITKLNNNFFPYSFSSDNQVLGLFYTSTDQVWIAKFNANSKAYTLISKTPLKTAKISNSYGDADFKFNEKGEAYFIINQYNTESYIETLDQGIYFQSANGQIEKLNINFNERVFSNYNLLGITNSGQTVIRMYHDDFSDYDRSTYAFLNKGIETGRWKKDFGNYTSNIFLANNKLFVLEADLYSLSGTMKLVSSDGNAQIVSKSSIPEGYEVVSVLENSQVLLLNFQNMRDLLISDLVNPARFFAKNPEKNEYYNRITANADGDLLSNNTLRFSKTNLGIADINCLFSNSTRLKFSEAIAIHHSGMLLVEAYNIDNYKFSYLLLTVQDLNKPLPNYCSYLSKPTFSKNCAAKVISGADRLFLGTDQDYAYTASSVIKQNCSLTVSVKDSKGKLLKGVVAKLIDKGQWMPDADGGGYFDPPRLIQEIKTNSKGRATLSGKVFGSNHDFELIVPYRNKVNRSRSVYLFGPAK